MGAGGGGSFKFHPGELLRLRNNSLLHLKVSFTRCKVSGSYFLSLSILNMLLYFLLAYSVAVEKSDNNLNFFHLLNHMLIFSRLIKGFFFFFKSPVIFLECFGAGHSGFVFSGLGSTLSI